jgi:ABC-type amino acid transport substrate-binding protein
MMKSILLAMIIVSQLRGMRGAPTGPQSQLSQTISAAFREVAADGTKYADLYKKYLLVDAPAPNTTPCGDWIPSDRITPGSALDRVFKEGKIRFGYTNRQPFHFKDKDGKSVGFEYELAALIVERIRAHYKKPELQTVWVEKKSNPNAAGLPAQGVVEAMVAGLKAGEFDVAFSGINGVMGETGMSPACPTMSRFSTVLYTGKDNLDVSKLRGAGRQALLQFMKDHPGMSFISTAGGASDMTSTALISDLKAIGGTATANTNNAGLIAQSIRGKSVHFVIGDGIALSQFSSDPSFQGVDLHIDTRVGMMGNANMGVLGPFTLKDPG